MFIRSILKASALLYTAVSAQTACNNSPSLCSRPYNNITNLGTHNAAFLRDESTSFNTAGNQFYNATVQLSAGVRMLTAQVHQFNTSSGASEWHLCHGKCDFLDAGKLENWLREVKTWMDANTNDVVTILLVNSDRATADVLGGQFSASGIDKYAYSPSNSSSTSGGGTTTLPQTWPTLQNLISNNTRLVTFIASLPNPSSKYPYLLDEFTYVYENNFENETPTAYSCDPNRPTGLTRESAVSSNRMFLMNHFLYSTQLFGIQQPNVTYTNVTNSVNGGQGSLGAAISNCTGVYNKPPNFILVDFFNVGPAIESVDRANGVQQAVGRQAVSTAIVDDKNSKSGKPGQPNTAEGGARASFAAMVGAVGFAVALGL
ncbi:hypothetical protein DM02DRAFT_296136 [Periconia macrospinosa]|uniref:PLC-like phosphodiesterase n=1 Tax=Periconia macrospinosa TaxID=97972 RepID=A0A2V1D4P9_9PLEO|nr:hypothetical protein DM02DRAFT_296136 [Periconia macrospinosa]